jgi:cation transport regulator ChaC
MADDQWIFGYGSLLWRPAFEFLEREPGFILGFQRRFWQASPDHRGTPDAPGRVVTLIEGGIEPCWGVGYRVAAEVWPAVLEELDYREKAGYQRRTATLYFRDRADPATALLYIASPDNPNFRGDAPLEAIAEVARRAAGPSGSNREYVLELHAALVDMGGRDDHVAALAALIGEE